MTPAKQLSSVQVQTDAQGRLVLRTNNPSKTAQPVNARLPEVTGQELGDLFFPITPEAFTAAYWGRQPLFVKGSVEKLERLIPGGFGREDFFRVARETTEKGLVNFKLQAGYYQGIITDDEATPRPFVPITPDQMEPMFAAGANLMADYLHEPRLAKLVAALKTQLQHAGTIDFLLTLSPQSNGWRPHLDRTSVIAVQLEGTKRYVISPGPVQAWPRGTATIGTDGQVTSYEYDAEAYDEIPPVEMSSLYEVVLEPGDLLYLPSGTIHSTAATTGHTLNLNLLFAQANFTDLLSRVLNTRLVSDPNWRHLPPIKLADQQAGVLPNEARDFFAARLTEAQAALRELTSDAYELNQHWHKMIADPGEAHLTSLAFSTTREPITTSSVQPTDRLRLARRAPMTMACGTDSDGDPCVTLYYANREVSAAAEWTLFLQTLTQQTEFTAQTATTWSHTEEAYPWPMVQEYLQALREQGFIEQVTA